MRILQEILENKNIDSISQLCNIILKVNGIITSQNLIKQILN